MRMKSHIIRGIAITLALGGAGANAQTGVNTWRGDASGDDWNNQYKWKLNHAPSGDEAAHFRGSASVIQVNSTIQLNNGMHLYGEELSLQGNGNINLWNPVPHQRTVNIPASATGFANMTLNDNISLNGRVALSAKNFGTSASKGSITLKDRANVTGSLSIGNQGSGTGQVYVKDSSTYRVTGLELQTKAASGGSAEIHIQGGTVRLETKENPFNVFLEDASRKLIIGDGGTLRVEYSMPISRKKDALKQLILKDRVVAAPGCRLTTPIIQDKMVIVRAEDERNSSSIETKEQLIAAIDSVAAGSSASAALNSQPKQLESLLKNMRGTSSAPAAPGVATAPVPNAPVAAPVPTPAEGQKIVSYVAFLGAAMLMLRRAKKEDESEEK